MGNKNRPYEGPRMSLGQKEAYVKNQGTQNYGINERDYYDDEGNENDRDQLADTLQAMNKDYDLRDSQKYGKDAGLKGFDKLGNNLSSLHDAYNTHRVVTDYGTNELGMKNVSSANDFGNISNDLFNKSRENFGEQFATKDDLSAMQKVREITQSEDKPEKQLSARGKAAIDAANYVFNPVDRNLGSPDYAYDPKAGIASKEAGDFMNNYKFNMQSRF